MAKKKSNFISDMFVDEEDPKPSPEKSEEKKENKESPKVVGSGNSKKHQKKFDKFNKGN